MLLYVDGAVQADRQRIARDMLQQPGLRRASAGTGCGGSRTSAYQTGEAEIDKVSQEREIAAAAAGAATRATAAALSAEATSVLGRGLISA